MLGIGQITTRMKEVIRPGQIVQGWQPAVVSTTSTSMVDLTGMTVTITPVAVSSKILVIVDMYLSEAAANSWFAQMLRGTTNVGGDTVNSFIGTGIATAWGADTCNVAYIDSPATTDATTYKIQWKTDGNTLYLNRVGSASSRSGVSSITVMEILA